jgi:hypothetical protein
MSESRDYGAGPEIVCRHVFDSCESDFSPSLQCFVLLVGVRSPMEL